MFTSFTLFTFSDWLQLLIIFLARLNCSIFHSVLIVVFRLTILNSRVSYMMFVIASHQFVILQDITIICTIFTVVSITTGFNIINRKTYIQNVYGTYKLITYIPRKYIVCSKEYLYIIFLYDSFNNYCPICRNF